MESAPEVCFTKWAEDLRDIAHGNSKVQFLDLCWLSEEAEDVADLYLPLLLKNHTEAKKAAWSRCCGRLKESTKLNDSRHAEVTILRSEDLEQLLCPAEKKPVRCLLVAPPGCGKTMTCYQVLYLWASGKAFTRFKAVVYLTGGQETTRIFSSEPSEFLGLDQSQFENEKQPILEYLASHGEDLLIIVDAADELGRDRLLQKENPNVLTSLFCSARLASNRYAQLASASVIVTSRSCPAADDLIRSGLCDVLWHLAGFTPSHLKLLFEKRLGPERGDRLWVILNESEHKQLKDTIIEIPLLVTMVAILFEEKEKLPSTVTQIYQIMEENLAARAQQRKANGHSELSQIAHDVQPLSGLALQGLRKNKFVFNADEFDRCGEAGVLALESGILAKNPPRLLEGLQTTYRFSHITWLEFMAARALASVEGSRLKKFVTEIGLGNHRRFFWKLTAGQIPTANNLAELMGALREAAIRDGLFSASVHFFLINCILEWLNKDNKVPELSEETSTKLATTFCSQSERLQIDFHGHHFNMKDAQTIKSALQHFPVPALAFGQCIMERDHCQLVGKRLSGLTDFTLEHVSFKGNINGFTYLIKHLSQLVRLKLNYCDLGPAHAHGMKQLLQRNRRLATLYLIGNDLQAAGLLTLCDGITEGCLLETMMLNDNNLGQDFDGTTVGRALENVKALKSLCFTRNSLSSGDLEALLPHLVHHQDLTDLWLRYNSFDDCALQHISEFLSQRDKHRLSVCQPDSHPSNSDHHSSDNAGTSRPNLTIHLENNEGITKSGLHHLSSLPSTSGDKLCWNCLVVKSGKVFDENYQDALQLAKKRKGRLWVNDYGMTDDAAEKFVTSCVLKESIARHLLLDENLIGDKGAKSIAEGLKSNPNIRTLQLANNKVRMAGFHEILNALDQVSHHLEILVLKDNPIFHEVSPEDGIHHLNNFLRYLDLSSTGMGTEHGCKLIELLEFHKTLHFLAVSNNPLGDQFAKALASSLQNNKLSLIELSSTEITDCGAEHLADAAAKRDAAARIECIFVMHRV